MAAIPLSVQLYTLRDLTAKDMPNVLTRLAKLGYRYVELAGFGNLQSAKDLRKALDDAGLKVSGAHVGLDLLETRLEQVLADNQILGNKNIIVPWVPPELRKSEDDWKRLAGSVGQVATKAAVSGFEVAYHNHDFEFVEFGGKTALEIILEATTAKVELDVFWVAFAGRDPVAWIEKLSGRLTLLHLKDLAAGPEKRFAPVGTGTLDFAKILAAGARANVRFGIVEQDNTYEMDPMKAVEISLRNLQAMESRK